MLRVAMVHSIYKTSANEPYRVKKGLKRIFFAFQYMLAECLCTHTVSLSLGGKFLGTVLRIFLHNNCFTFFVNIILVL